MIQFTDLERLINEISASSDVIDPATWCERNDIEVEAVGEFVNAQVGGLCAALFRRDVKLLDMPAMLTISAFLIGWEAHKQLGRRDAGDFR